jgi:hypothetical protein
MILLFILLFIIILTAYSFKGGGERKKKNAIVTMFILNETYLPGILTLAMSILTLFKNNKLDNSMYYSKDPPKKDFDLVCACDKNISDKTRKLVLQYYDRIVELDEFSVPEKNVKINLIFNENRDAIKKLYAATMRKFKILDLVEYNKILYTDCDTIFYSRDFLDLFKLQTPAAITFAEFTTITARYGKKTSNYGKSSTLYERAQNKDFVDGTLLVLTPAKGEYEKMIEFTKKKNSTCSVDSFCISSYWDKIYTIEQKYYSRYIETNIIILDMHGPDYKPWFAEAKYIFGVWYIWADIYNSFYKLFFEKHKNSYLDSAYKKTLNIPRNHWPYAYDPLNKFFEVNRKIRWYKLYMEVMPNRTLPSINCWL